MNKFINDLIRVFKVHEKKNYLIWKINILLASSQLEFKYVLLLLSKSCSFLELGKVVQIQIYKASYETMRCFMNAMNDGYISLARCKQFWFPHQRYNRYVSDSITFSNASLHAGILDMNSRIFPTSQPLAFIEF